MYEKVRPGIWVYNGEFLLVDARQEESGARLVCRFRLRAVTQETPTEEPGPGEGIDHTRVIPTSVKRAVWSRDNGRCRECGSEDNLNFDHIIPFSRGGSSLTAENIQLLCARHNLQKHDRIVQPQGGARSGPQVWMLVVKVRGSVADPGGMYQCYHCKDLHFSSNQALECAKCGQDWLPGAMREAERQAKRGSIPWWYKMAVRVRQPWTTPERALWFSLQRALPGRRVYSQWWLPGLDYRVDFLFPDTNLVVEVDGRSHQGREGADRLRSRDIWKADYEVARVTVDAVMEDADRIAAQIAFRLAAAAYGTAAQIEVEAEVAA